MSSGDSKVLSDRVEAIEKDVDLLASTLAQARTTRLIIFLLLVGLVATISYVTYRELMHFKSKENLELLAKKAEARFKENAPLYNRELNALIENTRPVLSEAFLEQTNKDMPKYTAALEKEREQLLESMQTRLTDQINEHYRQSVDRHKELLKSEFPEIDDPVMVEQLSLAMQEAMENILKKYFADELASELEEMYATWDKFPAAPADKEVEKEFIGKLLQLLTTKFSQKSGGELLGVPGV